MTSTPNLLAAPPCLVPLAVVITNGPDDQEPAPGFVANLHGETVEVTAVLQRTAVVAPLGDRWADKQVVRLADLQVNPEAITWRPKALSAAFERRRHSAEQREAMRAASDRRARADQARRAATQTATRQAAAPPSAARPVQPAGDAAASRPAPAKARQRPHTASVVATTAATKTRPATDSLAADLLRARQRIGELEAELEHYRAVARDMQLRVQLAIEGRAA